MKYLKNKTLQNIIYFLMIFTVFVMRCPKDLFTPYLWGEDGTILITDSAMEGIFAIDNVTNGTLWVIQKTVGVISYYIAVLFRSFSSLPMIQGVITKFLEALGISYFLSDKFSFLVKERFVRFLFCIMTILTFPTNSIDVITCDTSLPFILIIPVFLIGVYLFCGGKDEETGYYVKLPTVFQTVFLCLMAISSASAPLIGGMCALCGLLWLFERIKAKKLTMKEFAPAAVKMACVGLSVLIQLITVMSSDRAPTELALKDRIYLTVRNYVFWPKWMISSSKWLFAERLRVCDVPYNSHLPALCIFLFLAGIAFYAFLFISKKVDRRVMAFSVLSSYLFFLLCSFTGEIKEFLVGLAVGQRFVYLPVYISMMLILLFSYNLSKEEEKLKVPVKKIFSAGVVLLFLVLYIPDYIMTPANDYLYEYWEMSCDDFSFEGDDIISCRIGPWGNWRTDFPADFTNASDDVSLTPVYASGSTDGVSQIVSLDADINDGREIEKIYVKNSEEGKYSLAFYEGEKSEKMGEFGNEGIFTYQDYYGREYELIAVDYDGGYHRAVFAYEEEGLQKR